MQEHYFTPEIEDIRVGYECEKDDLLKGWQPFVFDLVTVRDRVQWEISDYQEEFYRVPYLTKEQIEAEGYPIIGIYPSGGSLHKKDLYEITFLPDFRLKIVKVWKSFEGEPNEKSHRKDLYNGICKDINTFRQIQKLLGI